MVFSLIPTERKEKGRTHTPLGVLNIEKGIIHLYNLLYVSSPGHN